MNCEFQEEVSAWFDGELPESDVARIRAHVAECASCGEMLRDFESLRESLRQIELTDVPRLPLWQRRVRIPLPVAAVLAIVLVGLPFVTFRRGERAAAPNPAVQRSNSSGVLAQYDGGGRAVIAVRPKEQVR